MSIKKLYGLSVAGPSHLFSFEDKSYTAGLEGAKGEISRQVDCRFIESNLWDPSKPSRHLPDAYWFIRDNPKQMIITYEDLFQLRISTGRHIDVCLRADSSRPTLELFLVGSAMGCILYQRGMIPLHISSVYINGQAWAFTGPSGTGKSTFAARLHRFSNCRLVSDDVAALYLIGSQPHVAGGPPLMKLHPEFAALFPDAHIEPIPHAESNKLKVQVQNSFVAGLVPLAGIIVLERDETVRQGGLEIEPLAGVEAFMGAKEASYCYNMGLAMSSQGHMFSKLAELTAHVPFYRGRLGHWTVADGGSTEAAIVERISNLQK